MPFSRNLPDVQDSLCDQGILRLSLSQKIDCNRGPSSVALSNQSVTSLRKDVSAVSLYVT